MSTRWHMLSEKQFQSSLKGEITPEETERLKRIPSISAWTCASRGGYSLYVRWYGRAVLTPFLTFWGYFFSSNITKMIFLFTKTNLPILTEFRSFWPQIPFFPLKHFGSNFQRPSAHHICFRYRAISCRHFHQINILRLGDSYVYASVNLVTIGSCNGLSPIQHQPSSKPILTYCELEP